MSILLNLYRRRTVWAITLVLVHGLCWAAPRLPALDADLSQTSVSGISSGGHMAVQLHIAYSATIKGAGVIAGGPYDCAEGDVSRAIHNCMQPDRSNPLPTVKHLKSITDALARSGAIDPTSNLHGARVWLFSGKDDTVVEQPVMDLLERYYQVYVPAEQIVYVKNIKAGHAMITADYGNACAVTAEPYIDDCDYDAAGTLLGHIYGKLNPPAAQPAGSLVEFDQSEFLGGDAFAHSLSETGVAYVPKSCQSHRCRVHVALHGCLQNQALIGDQFYGHAGYNRWADTNDIIVLYPQTIARYGWGWPFVTPNFMLNPNACWDWWGYDSRDYYKKSGPQLRAIKGMLDRLGEKRPGT
jgi:poly(3-hydroxybutyrate) depolymerase